MEEFDYNLNNFDDGLVINRKISNLSKSTSKSFKSQNDIFIKKFEIKLPNFRHIKIR